MKWKERLKWGDGYPSEGARPLKLNYDHEEDILYIVVKEGQVFDSKEIDEDIRLEYDKNGEVAGIEIMNARKNLAKPLAQEIAKEMRTRAGH